MNTSLNVFVAVSVARSKTLLALLRRQKKLRDIFISGYVTLTASHFLGLTTNLFTFILSLESPCHWRYLATTIMFSRPKENALSTFPKNSYQNLPINATSLYVPCLLLETVTQRSPLWPQDGTCRILRHYLGNGWVSTKYTTGLVIV